MKNIALFLSVFFVTTFIFAKPAPKTDTIDSWEVYVNNKLLITENAKSKIKTIQLDMISKSAVFAVNYTTFTPIPKTKYLEVVNKNGVVLKKYTFEDQSGSEQMSFKVADFFDYLGEDEKLTIYYYEKSGKRSKTEKIKLVEVTF